ncbi:hypothetical protein FF011L_35170 [Roseimaritima multifibrata]|uniref:Uncharacterized protein n=1 Tax=Roseimaritima multifibrata TaxID=1930274 RepID=A0A517MIM1_9BACT|nr:hypothetical protein [Roseimaritima multifibrata]QDS94736.1 hypothetical protein FF011L_35170 [Roseimaritima multifibrata]
MKYALIITGVLAGLAITAPRLVVFGYFLLIVPGFVLTIAPTVFIYLTVTAVVRRLLPISSPMKATAVAFGVALLLGWAVMQSYRVAALDAYRADELPDVLSSQLIELDGDVRIERPDHRREPECDYLTLAVLESPGVDSVTTVTAGRGKPSDTQPSAAYALVSAKADPAVGIFPNEPGQIVRKYPPLVQANRGKKFFTSIKAVEANWAVRLAGQERLREVKEIEAEAADWIIRIDNPLNQPTDTLRRLTILDSSGEVRFRKSYRKQAVPARMFYFRFQANMSGGPVSASFYVGRQLIESGQWTLKPETALLEAIKFNVPVCDAKALEVLRDQTVQTLDDPMATTAQLELARRYLGFFFFDAKPGNHALIARIVADDRVRDLDAVIKNVFPKNQTPTAMKDAFIDRIAMEHTSASLRHLLAERLASFPRGTFANPSPTYLAILNSPEIYQQAAPLIATLADVGPEHAIPKLDAMLDTAIALPHWSDRRTLIAGIREALVRLGPQASAVVPRIRELFLIRPSPIMNSSSDAGQWRLALARMGVAIEDLPVLPNQSPPSADRNLRRVANKLERRKQAETPEQGL